MSVKEMDCLLKLPDTWPIVDIGAQTQRARGGDADGGMVVGSTWTLASDKGGMTREASQVQRVHHPLEVGPGDEQGRHFLCPCLVGAAMG